MKQLEGKTAVITGAGNGLGRGIAKMYASHGAAVGVADLDGDAAQRVADEITAGGGRALAVAMDVGNEQAVDTGIEAVVEAFGGVDILVSNAGIQIVKPLEDFSFDEWRLMQAVHMDGAFLTTRACLKHMYAAGRGGSIIYMGSVHSHEASRLKAPYVAAKHALLGLARAIAKEGGPHGVRSNVICPGFVRTELVEKQIPEQAQALGITEEEVIRTVMLKDTVDGEFTTIDDIARCALFLAAYPTNALTGQSLVVSHGWHMQ